MSNRSTSRAIVLRVQTIGALIGYFTRADRLPLLIPVVLSVLVAGALLLVTGGLSYVAPFVYAMF
jgi:uncharacterized membrane protein (UPF0136 family)